MNERTFVTAVSSRYKALVLLIMIAAGIFRFTALDADPPVSVGVHFISDEGWWVHNARNKILFGEWILDEFNQSLLVSPPFCLATYFVYKFAGVGFFSSRVIPALSGLLAVFFFWLILKKHFDPARAVIGTAILGLGFGFCSINRIAYVDSTAFLFLMITWWLLEYFSDRVWAVYLAGLGLGLALMTKSYVLSLAPVVVILSLHRMRATGMQFRIWFLNVCLVTAGILTAAAFWYKGIYLPFRDQYAVMYHLWRDGNIPSGLFQMIHNIPSLLIRADPNGIHFPRFVLLNIALLFAVWWRFSMLMFPGSDAIGRRFRSLSILEREAFVWLMIHTASIAPLIAKPFRRYLFLYPPLIIIALTATQHTDTSQRTRGSWFQRVIHGSIAAMFPALLVSIPVADWLVSLKGSFFQVHKLPSAVSLFGLTMLFLAVIAIAFFQHRRWKSMPLGLLLAAWLIWDGSLYVQALHHLSFSLRDTSRHLGTSYFREKRVVLGGIADTLCLETKARALAIWGREEAPRVLNQNPVERFHPDYIVVLTRLDGLPWVRENRYFKYLSPEKKLETILLCPTGETGFRFEAELYKAPVQ